MNRRRFCISSIILFGSLAISQTSCMLLRSPITRFMFSSYIRGKIKDALENMIAESGTISENSSYKSGLKKSSKPYNSDIFSYISPEDMKYLEGNITILIKYSENLNEENAMQLANHLIDQWNDQMSIEDSRNHINNCTMCEDSYERITDGSDLQYAKLDDNKEWFNW